VALVAGCSTPDGSPPPAQTPTDQAVGELGTASPDSSTSRYGVALDVLEDGTLLRTTEGRTFPIPGDATYVVRVPLGWLYGQATGPVTLLTPDGATRELAPATVDQQSLEMPGTPVLSADGNHIAWSGPGTVYTGRITADGIEDVVSSPAPGDTYPLLWVGTRVVLGQTYDGGCCGYRRADYDIWDPAAGDFVPQWTRELWPIYGPTPAGAGLFAIERTDTLPAGCLVRLDAVRDLSTTMTACVPGLSFGSLGGLLAPDGRHLVERAGDGLAMFDLDTVLQTNAPLHACAGDTAYAWEDNATVLLIDGSRTWYRCSVDDAGSGPVAGLNDASQPLTVVPRVGSTQAAA
jgi:hypothetical protein